MEKTPPEVKSEALEVMAVKEEKKLISWKALARAYQKKDRDFWVTALASAGLICVILFVIGEWGLIAAILSLIFFYYVLTTVKPEEVDYRITNKGVYFPGSEERIDWELLKSYFLTQKWGHTLLKINTYLRGLTMLSLVVPDVEKEKVEQVLKKYLPEGKEEKNAADKVTHWVYKRLPFEIEKRVGKK
ncbi:MAG: hypothetical protein ABIB61_04860 [Candidatus Shapirobacteria bacterium]